MDIDFTLLFDTTNGLIMKKTLLMMSLLGSFALPASAAIEMTFEPSSQTSMSNAHVNQPMLGSASEVGLVDSLESLTIQAQSHDNRLNSLASNLTIEQNLPQPTTASFATSNNTFSRSTISSSAPPAIAAARASRAAHSRTKGLCARYVRKALQAAGYSFTPNASAYQYATRGTLANAGFVKISNNTSPQVGDVVVYSRTAKHKHGHIQIFDGSRWVSDFVQPDKTPYSDHFNYTTWRDARYNNASNEGVYLAMED